jgi:aryl-alcohol dehydrogenase-like predicted oxidoreductase
MEFTVLGRTGLRVSRTAFGVLPIQRVTFAEARMLLWKGFEHGINFFDTARAYSDSEEKIGYALADVRDQIFIATKTHGTSGDDLNIHLNTSLHCLKTDYVDLLQFHNPDCVPRPEDEDGRYQAMLAARDAGKVRCIGVTYHRLDLAREAVASGLYDTVQFPLSAISSPEDLALVDLCREHNVGLIAMKPLCGGLLANAPAAFAFLRQYDNVVPIWGIQRECELDELLELSADPPALDAAMWQSIEQERAELSGNFCRACGYCLPCPADIPIPMAARMTLLLNRMPYQQFLTDVWQEYMSHIEQCTECGQCASRCPYGLDTPRLLRENLEGYRERLLQLR